MNRVSLENPVRQPKEHMTLDESTSMSVGAHKFANDFGGAMILNVIRGRLHRSVYIAIREVQTEFIDGLLYFRGTVPTFYTKQVLLSLAGDLGALGVVKVVDETVVMKH